MRTFLKILFLVICTSCGSEVVENNCFYSVQLNEVINLNNAQFIDLQVPEGSVIAPIGGRNILIIRRSSRYQAFDMECPEKNCTTPMTFDNLFLKCSCDSKKYNSLSGCPVNEQGNCLNDSSCFALEYNVLEINSSSLQISR